MVAVRLFTEFGLTPASRQRVDRTPFAALDEAERFLSEPGDKLRRLQSAGAGNSR